MKTMENRPLAVVASSDKSAEMHSTDTAILTQFADYQRLRGFREATIKRRTTTLRLFAARLYPERSLVTATLADVEGYLAAQKCLSTQHSYRSDLRSFYIWGTRRGLLPNDPTALVDPIRVPACLPRPVPRERISGLIEAATDPDVRLMVALGAYAGLRCMDMAHLSTDDVQGGVLIVRDSKGAKDRVVPLHPVLARLLAERPQGPVFTLTAAQIGRRVAAHLRACGVRATAHQLRHTFGTELAAVSGGDLLLVAALMGHSDMKTTMGYTALGGDRGVAAVGELFAA